MKRKVLKPWAQNILMFIQGIIIVLCCSINDFELSPRFFITFFMLIIVFIVTGKILEKYGRF